MSVVYNGQSTNFIGEGSPNPTQLVTPRKDQMPSAVRAGFLQVERVINNLKAAASGFYASLTGPGETTTPGQLTQAGDFVVDSNGAIGIDLQAAVGPLDLSAGPGGIGIVSTGGIGEVDTSTTGIQVTEGGSGGIIIEDSGGGGVTVLSTAAGGVTIQNIGVGGTIDIFGADHGIFIGSTPNDIIGFFGAFPAVGQQPAPTTLAQVITGLQNLGLFA